MTFSIVTLSGMPMSKMTVSLTESICDWMPDWMPMLSVIMLYDICMNAVLPMYFAVFWNAISFA